MNKNQILWLSEPIEQAYINCTSRLIVNMARHFKSGKALSMFEWQAAKLAEMGALRKESIQIIAKETGKREELIRGTLEAALGMDLGEIDDLLIRAAEAGVIRMPSETYLTSGRIQDLLEAMTQNTVEATNLVNTTMLQSTLSSYRQALGQATVEEMRLGEQLAAAQSELNTAALSVASGAESRTQALRYAIRKMTEEGLTGFIDKAGRHWAPEGYVNMDIRTTVHNIAIQGQRIRSEEAGVSTFQISSHAGARPLCAPYQGKFYSWDGTSGILHDLNGGEHPYEGIGMTSYGEPAGIFGINCGHSPITFVDGFSIPRYSETEDKEENDRIYKESQQQRALEREIRKTRTEAAALNAAGDEEGFAQAARKANNQLIRYQDFCKEKDRTPRLDRLQVYGYNKNVAGKATQGINAYETKRNHGFLQAGARILNPYGDRGKAHAERYYGLVRSMKTDVTRIAKNTGYDKDAIQRIKNYLFIESHDLGEHGFRPFFPSCDIAQSWQRLMEGRNIQPHDLTLLKHEIMEQQLMRSGLTQDEAHFLTSQTYNYGREADDYYATLKKNNKK